VVGTVLLVVLVGLATYRATRLVVRDDFPPIRWVRHRVERWAGRSPRREWVGDLATCHWCASGWISLALLAGIDLATTQPVPLPVVTWLAAWAVGATIAHLEPEK
jgi:hypothetical protein